MTNARRCRLVFTRRVDASGSTTVLYGNAEIEICEMLVRGCAKITFALFLPITNRTVAQKPSEPTGLKIERDLHNTRKATIALLIRRLAKEKYTPTSSAPQIPALALFDPLFAPQPPDPGIDAALPSIAQCAGHLGFLECLFTLRQRMLQSAILDAVFGIQEHHRTVTRDGKTVKLKDPTLRDRRQAKWKSFVECSVARFLLWRRNVDVWCPSGQAWSFTQQTLPPLGVLMVLHALLLNPALFQRHCGSGPLRDMRFLWALVHRDINRGSWEFSLSPEATARFAE